MLSQTQIPEVLGRAAYDPAGDKIGTVGQVYVDEHSGEPRWVTIRTGLFGTKESFVPVDRAELSGDQLRVPVSKEMVKDAPRVELDHERLPDDEAVELYRYYNLPYEQGRMAELDRKKSRSKTPLEANGRRAPAGKPGKRPDATEMTAHEERLRVGTEEMESGRVRLRKYVVTETVETTVPVRHEEVRVEREPVRPGERGADLDGEIFVEEEAEVVLHAERPVIDKETVATERVRLNKSTREEQQTVGGRVRKERIDVDGDEQQQPRRR